MRKTLASVFSLLSSYALLLLANGLFGTLIGIRTKLEGFPTVVVGFIVGGYFLGLLLGGVFAVRVVAAVGHIRAFAAFASIMSVSALGIVLVIDPLAWGVMRLMGGFCMAGMIMVTESWLNERCTNETRGRVLSFYMITNYLAAGCGQFLLPLGDPGDFQLFVVASIIYSLALVPVLLTRSTAPRPVPAVRSTFRELWRISPLGFIGAFSAGIVNSNFNGLGPVFAHGIGLSVASTSTFMASVIFGGLLLQWPVGRLSDRIDRRTVLAGAALGTALASFALATVAGESTTVLFSVAVVYGGLSFTIYSLCAAHTNDFSDPDKLIQTAGGLLVAYGIGACSGPVLTSALMERYGPPALFLASGAVYTVLSLFAFYRMYARAAKAKEDQSPMIPLPGGQFTSGTLYNTMRDQMDRDLARMSGGPRRRR